MGEPQRPIGADAVVERIHDAVRLGPESVWPELRQLLADPAWDPFDLTLVDLVEDLMFWHADAFAERLEQLVDEAPHLRAAVATAHLGGRATDEGLERFLALQDRLLAELEAEGVLSVWRGTAPFPSPGPSAGTRRGD